MIKPKERQDQQLHHQQISQDYQSQSQDCDDPSSQEPFPGQPSEEASQQCPSKNGLHSQQQTAYNDQMIGSGQEPRNSTTAQRKQEATSAAGGSTSGAGESDFLNRPYQELNPLEKLKYSQYVYKKKWKGISTEYTGRPGTSTLCNKKRHFAPSEHLIQEDEKAYQLLKVLSLLQSLEQELPLLVDSNSTLLTGVGAGGCGPRTPYQKKQLQNKQVDLRSVVQGYQAFMDASDSYKFKTITEKQLLNDLPPTQSFGGKGPHHSYHIDNCEFLYKILRGDTKLVRSLLEANHFTYTESHEWNILWSSSSCKAYLYEGLNEYQRINHFPQSYEVTRKDRLCYNMVKMQEKFGRSNFEIVPDTYILPNEFKEFKEHFDVLAEKEPKKNIWIVKPANLSRGRGIYLIDSIRDVHIDDQSVISRYITNPLLINGHKFDLRIYVLVTSYEPLRVYVFKEGLARFASETYTSKIDKNNKYMHLTNYSINKKNDNFVYNQNHEQDDVGFKWSLSAFCKHLEQVGIDMALLWSRIYDVILKSLIAGEHYVLAALKKHNLHRNNCFEIFGYDIILDSELKPWLLEVNLSPSLACDSPLDLTIKSNLLADTFNMVSVKRFDRRKESLNKLKNRQKLGNQKFNNFIFQTNGGPGSLPSTSPNDLYLAQQTFNPQLQATVGKLMMNDEVGDLAEELQGLEDSIERMSLLKCREILAETVSEYCRRGSFVRIYPAKGSNQYDQFFQGARPLNRMLYKALYNEKLLNSGVNSSSMNIVGQGSTIESKPLPKKQYSMLHHQQSVDSIYSTGGGCAVSPTVNTKKQAQQQQHNQQSDFIKVSRRLTEKGDTTKSVSSTVDTTQINNGESNPNNGGKIPLSVTPSATHSSTGGGGKISKYNPLENLRPATSGGKKPAFAALQDRQNQLEPASFQSHSHQASSSHIQKLHSATPKAADSSPLNQVAKPSQQSSNHPSQEQQLQQQEKIIITGDDILIEYVSRIVYILESEGLPMQALPEFISDSVNRFVNHSVWHVKEQIELQSQWQEEQLSWQLMNIRLTEMLDRRRRLLKYTFKKEGRLGSGQQTFETLYKDALSKKTQVVSRFTSQQLEDLLKTSTKNVAQEVVSCMIPVSTDDTDFKGLLIELEKISPERAQERKVKVKEDMREEEERQKQQKRRETVFSQQQQSENMTKSPLGIENKVSSKGNMGGSLLMSSGVSIRKSYSRQANDRGSQNSTLLLSQQQQQNDNHSQNQSVHSHYIPPQQLQQYSSRIIPDKIKFTSGSGTHASTLNKTASSAVYKRNDASGAAGQSSVLISQTFNQPPQSTKNSNMRDSSSKVKLSASQPPIHLMNQHLPASFGKPFSREHSASQRSLKLFK